MDRPWHDVMIVDTGRALRCGCPLREDGFRIYACPEAVDLHRRAMTHLDEQLAREIRAHFGEDV